MTGHLFISYKSEENPFTLKLAADLRNRGVSVWVDRLDGGIETGDIWTQRLDQALKSCSGMIAILTPDYFTSKVCLDELDFAYRENRPIFPILMRKTPGEKMPFWLPGRQWIDFTGFLDEVVYQQQLTTLYQRIQRDQSSAVGNVPGREMQYLTRLIADLETEQGVENYIALSGQSEVVRQNARAQKLIDPSLALLLGDSKLKSRFGERLEHHPIADIHEAVAQHPKFVLIGEPGAGKTTTLRRLALEQARARQAWLQNSTSFDNPPPIPLLVYLPSWRDEPTPADYVRRVWERETQLGGDPLGELQAGNIHLYLDGLNEMGAEGERKAQLLRDWLANKSPTPQHVIFTCRKDDYVDELDLKLPTVAIESLTDDKIREFALKYLDDKAKTEDFLRKIFPDADVFSSEKEHSKQRSLAHLARTPYLLAALLLIYEDGGDLPRNTGALFKGLVTALWERERLRGTLGWMPLNQMQAVFGWLAFNIIDTDLPVDIPFDYALEALGSLNLLNAGRSAGLILQFANTIRFASPLVLEYFAAFGLGLEIIPTKINKPFFFDTVGRLRTKWDEVILAKCGITLDSEIVLKTLIDIDPFLVAELIGKGINTTNGTMDRLVEKVLNENRAPVISVSRALCCIPISESIHRLLDMITTIGILGRETIAIGIVPELQNLNHFCPLLASELNNHDSDIRSAAVWLVGELKLSSLVSDVIKLLFDTHRTKLQNDSEELMNMVRYSKPSDIRRICDVAAEALEKIGTPEALEAVRQWREQQQGLG